MTVKNGHPCTEWFSSLCFQTIRKHMEKQSPICTQKTSFYTDNITSTLTIVVFSINWLWLFALYVRCMCCKLELKTLNRKTTASLRNHQKCRVCSDPCICTTQWYSCVFFQWSFAWNLKNISPIVWYCCNIRHPYKISSILYKTNEKAISFLLTTSRTSRDLSRDKDAMRPGKWTYSPSFSQPHGVFVWKHRKVCCGLLQWSDVGTVVWCRTFTVHFFRSLLRLFSSFLPIWVCEMKVLWKVASSRAEDLKTVFFMLSWVQREKFHYDKAVSCKSYMQLLIQDVYSISSKTCQL